MSAYGLVELDWRCPACAVGQPDTLFWAGKTNRARATVKCAGCERTLQISLAVYIRMVEEVPATEAKDGEG